MNLVALLTVLYALPLGFMALVLLWCHWRPYSCSFNWRWSLTLVLAPLVNLVFMLHFLRALLEAVREQRRLAKKPDSKLAFLRLNKNI